MSDKKLILVVDDDTDLVEMVAMKLESRGFRVGKAYDGDPSSIGLSRWLLGHVRSVALSPAGPDVASGLAKVHRRALGVIDTAEEAIWYGYCTVEQADDDEGGKHRRRRHARPALPDARESGAHQGLAPRAPEHEGHAGDEQPDQGVGPQEHGEYGERVHFSKRTRGSTRV